MRGKRYLVFSILLGLSIAGFLVYYILSKPKFDTAVQYNSQEIQKDILALLEERNIPYKLDKDKFILYRSDYEREVKSVLKEIEKRHSLPLPNKYLSNPTEQKYFLSLLEKSNIPFEIMKLDAEGNDYVVWEWNYDAKVQDLLLEVYEKSGLTKKPARMAFQDPDERNIFLSLLQEENIPFKTVNSELANIINVKGGVIEYEWKYHNKVQRLREKALHIKRNKKE
jgi:hypothetical protein